MTALSRKRLTFEETAEILAGYPDAALVPVREDYAAIILVAALSVTSIGGLGMGFALGFGVLHFTRAGLAITVATFAVLNLLARLVPDRWILAA